MKSESVALLLVLLVLAGPLPAQIQVDDDAPAAPPSRRGSSSLPAPIHVDDDAPGDPSPFDRQISDPQEDGSSRHPYDSIQEAIDAAEDGAFIVVAPGRYLSRDPWSYDEINFKGKNVRLVGSARTDFSVIEGTILCGVVIFQGTEDPNCLLQGFKIQNHDCGGILGNKTRATISHCILSGNGPCGATVLKDVRGRIANCLIVDNATVHDCGVLPVVSGCPTLVNCTIANNISGVALNCDDPPKIDQIVIRNCIIWNNQDHEQIQILNRWRATITQIEYNLIENWRATAALTGLPAESTLLEDDPGFAQPGFWEEAPQRAAKGSVSTDNAKKVLVEGDYHLRSEGWRWTNGQAVHGSPWYFDTSTSPAVDAGDPMDSLGEEIERVPGDPEGEWGFNHSIDLGAYGGTRQASLSPTRVSPAPGVGAVDLQDYWPLGVSVRAGGTGPSRWFVHNPQGTARGFYVSGAASARGDDVYYIVYHVSTINAPDWLTKVNCCYANRTLYITQEIPGLILSLPLPPPGQVQAQYPQYLIAGATVQAPYDPFTKVPVENRSVLIARGTLAQVLTGTGINPAQLLAGAWPDVIALRGINADGTTGDPIAIFARGFGPLLLAGQPVEGAEVNGKTFGTVETSSPAARPATRG